MSKSKVGRPINYQAYVKEYEKRQLKLSNKGLKMADEMLSEIQYQTLYKARAKQLKEAGKSIGHIAEQIAAKQTYDMSTEQARKLQPIAEKYGFKVKTLTSVKEQKDKIFEEIKNRWETMDPDEREYLSQLGVFDFGDYISYLYGSK